MIEVSEFGDLSFLEAQKADSGRYTCTAENSLGQESASAYLNVISKFKIRDIPINEHKICVYTDAKVVKNIFKCLSFNFHLFIFCV